MDGVDMNQLIAIPVVNLMAGVNSCSVCMLGSPAVGNIQDQINYSKICSNCRRDKGASRWETHF